MLRDGTKLLRFRGEVGGRWGGGRRRIEFPAMTKLVFGLCACTEPVIFTCRNS